MMFFKYAYFGLPFFSNCRIYELIYNDPEYIHNGNINKDTAPGDSWDVKLGPKAEKFEINGNILLDSLSISTFEQAHRAEFIWNGSSAEFDGGFSFSNALSINPFSLKLAGFTFYNPSGFELAASSGSDTRACFDVDHINLGKEATFTNMSEVTFTGKSHLQCDGMTVTNSNVFVQGNFHQDSVDGFKLRGSTVWINGRLSAHNKIASVRYLSSDTRSVFILNDNIRHRVTNISIHGAVNNSYFAFPTNITDMKYTLNENESDTTEPTGFLTVTTKNGKFQLNIFGEMKFSLQELKLSGGNTTVYGIKLEPVGIVQSGIIHQHYRQDIQYYSTGSKVSSNFYLAFIMLLHLL